MIKACDCKEYVKLRQQNYAAASVLLPRAIKSVREERDQSSGHLSAIFDSIAPFIPGEIQYEIHVIDDCDVAETERVDDGRQLILISRNFIGFLRNIVELICRGIRVREDGEAIATYSVAQEDRELFGQIVGEYLNFRAPLTYPPSQEDSIGPAIFVAAIEFLIAHEITHRIEEDSHDYDPELDGFQDYCRLRAREYRADRRAVGLTLLRRKSQDVPEMAFLGAVCALLTISWIEQFMPGYVPGRVGSWHHPGSDSRVLRVHLEEQLFWKAAGLEGHPTDLTGAALRRAFLFLGALEQEPKLIASPLNVLVQSCINGGQANHDLFEARCGEVFARCRVDHVARSLGAMWGSSEAMAGEELAGLSGISCVDGRMNIFRPWPG